MDLIPKYTDPCTDENLREYDEELNSQLEALQRQERSRRKAARLLT